jgi:hypothetical protein
MLELRTSPTRIARLRASIAGDDGLRNSQLFHDPAAGRRGSDPAAGVDVAAIVTAHVADVRRACDPDR